MERNLRQDSWNKTVDHQRKREDVKTSGKGDGKGQRLSGQLTSHGLQWKPQENRQFTVPGNGNSVYPFRVMLKPRHTQGNHRCEAFTIKIPALRKSLNVLNFR